MSNPVRDGPSAKPKLGSGDEDIREPTSSDGGSSKKSLAMASGEARRIRLLVEKLMFTYAAGQTRRWHAMHYVIRTETIAAHSWNVVMWLIILHPNPSLQLIKAAMVHDVAEHVTGDMPRWFKEKLQGFSSLEAEVLQNQDLLFHLEPEEEQWLTALDLFDAWLFLRQNLLAGNRLVMDSYRRATSAMRKLTEPKEVIEVFNILYEGV